jgi:hypothetical protein
MKNEIAATKTDYETILAAWNATALTSQHADEQLCESAAQDANAASLEAALANNRVARDAALAATIVAHGWTLAEFDAEMKRQHEASSLRRLALFALTGDGSFGNDGHDD